jgi:hypothetical protein
MALTWITEVVDGEKRHCGGGHADNQRPYVIRKNSTRFALYVNGDLHRKGLTLKDAKAMAQSMEDKAEKELTELQEQINRDNKEEGARIEGKQGSDPQDAAPASSPSPVAATNAGSEASDFPIDQPLRDGGITAPPMKQEGLPDGAVSWGELSTNSKLALQMKILRDWSDGALQNHMYVYLGFNQDLMLPKFEVYAPHHTTEDDTPNSPVMIRWEKVWPRPEPEEATRKTHPMSGTPLTMMGTLIAVGLLFTSLALSIVMG